MMAQRPWVIIGNPENRRIECFQKALVSRGVSPACVLSYETLLKGESSLQSVPQDAVVRIESPGENLAVEHLLIKAGGRASFTEGSCIYGEDDWPWLPQEHGRILAPRQSYLGYVSSLRAWAGDGPDLSERLWTTTAKALETQFDKALCQALCASVGIPTPRPIGVISGWDELWQKMSEAGIERAFVKLANGSSASGIIAIRRRQDTVSATTSVEVVNSDYSLSLYNSLKLRRYTNLEEVKSLVDAVAKHRAYAEEWLPKASLGRRVCDLRLLVIAGEPRHAVVRTSRSPLTNLHLGNRRGEIGEFWQRVSDQQMHELWETCGHCAELFSESLHLGLDILFTPGFRKHYLLEINAFGDLLPRVTHRGANTYEAQVDAVLGGWTPTEGAVTNST